MKTRGGKAARGEHLVFFWSSSGYSLEVRQGAAPAPGAAVEDGEVRYRVSKIAPSPLPGDERSCAYLIPDGISGDGAMPGEGPLSDVASDLQLLFGDYPESACVVAVDDEGRRLAHTISTLVSLSLDPPLVGFAVANDEAIRELLPDAGGCAISLLAGGQGWLAEHFEGGARPIAMWHGLAAEPGAVGAPLFVGALGWLECSLHDAVEVGSHTFFVCEVRRLEPGPDAPALLRARGSYGST
jgi:3-hydroxy-9,10-secoandrosta-1,3,5(10)-triene-9,17-dione monooxygenase reductase component